MSKNIDFLLYDIIRQGEENKILNNNEKSEIYFNKAIDFLRFSYELLISSWNNISEEKTEEEINLNLKIFILTLYLQSIRIFRSIVILFKSGLDNESLILLRSLLESIAYLTFITEDDCKERYEHYRHSRTLSRYTAKKELSHINQQDEEVYKKAIEYFEYKHGKDFKNK